MLMASPSVSDFSVFTVFAWVVMLRDNKIMNRVIKRLKVLENVIMGVSVKLKWSIAAYYNNDID